MTPGSLESASLTTWTTQLNTVEAYAAERDKFGAELVTQVAEPLKQAATQYEEIRKCHADYHAKLEKERDASYGELKKAKGKYDGACQEVESRRKKMDSSFDHGKSKAQSAFQQQMLEMNNCKACQPDRKIFFAQSLTSIELISDQHQRDQQVEREILP